MTDREMLEAAARAIGIEKPHYENGSWLEGSYGLTEAIWSDDHEGYWNPLLDNADAFTLAVKLGLDLLRTEQDIEAIAGLPPYAPMERDVPAPFGIELLGDDACAATRRAITRVAAEIGRGMS